MKYELVSGDDIKKDVAFITEKMNADDDMVFVYTGKIPLYTYIEELDKAGKLSDEIQFRLKICYEKTGLNLTYKAKGNFSHRIVKVTSMHQLIGLLDKKECCIVVNNDDRSVLADIVQQFIYIGYPLTQAEILLKKDEKDRERARRFMAQVDVLDKKLKAAIEKLNQMVVDTEHKSNLQEILDSVKKSCGEIQQQMDKARQRQLKIAVAASKKTGNSVIVNGMIGEELAPTSLELATPNSCIYKKSDSEKYYLDYKGKKKHFVSAEELHEEIGEEFKKAQEEVSDKFTLPDMEIGYVSDKNNFEAYTVYDTPGPDAAGTGHGERAKEAMEQCDVAIFAIDYAKYLTTSEEAYLSQIKEQFNEKQKFGSLIFTINKVDERYNDASGSKSIIKSVDFIRNRLQKIDACYKDCAIFATSALQYFYALEAERECGDALRQSENLYNDIRPLISKYKKVKGQLNFLDKRVGDMVNYSGLPTVTLADLKQYSGMPDLLEYTSYIARTKARDELVNSVAYEIDAQQIRIQTVVNRIENIRRLVGENNERIQEISEIFREFGEEVNELLQKGITEDDIDGVDEQLEEEGVLREDWERIRENKGKECNFKNIKKEEIRKIEEYFDNFLGASEPNNYVELFIVQMQRVYFGYFSQIRRNETLVYGMNEQLLEDKVEEIAWGIREYILDRFENQQNIGRIHNLNRECEMILQKRLQMLAECMEECEGALRKMDVEFLMPSIPEFDFATEKSDEEFVAFGKMNTAHMDKIGEKLKELYKKPNVFKRLMENIKNHSWGEEKYQAESINKEKFREIFGNARGELCSIVNEIGLGGCIAADRDMMKQSVEQRVDQIEGYFSDTLAMLAETIKIFTGAVDDRDKYKEHNDRLEEEAAVIDRIQEAMRDFMGDWEEVCKGSEVLSKESA